jgi:CRISPR-associated protein Cpf1
LSLLGDIEKDGKICTKNIADYFINLGKTDDNETIFMQLEINYKNIEELLKAPYPANKDLAQEKSDVAKIKLFLDSLKAIQRFIKPLFNNNESDKDEKFYGEFIHYWESLDKITPLYNKVRNYMTKKPYSEEKFKLNFENSTLLDGWDVNKEADNTAVLFRKDNLFYLGIMNKKNNNVFKQDFEDSTNQYYEKVEYKLLRVQIKCFQKYFYLIKELRILIQANMFLITMRREHIKKAVILNLKIVIN